MKYLKFYKLHDWILEEMGASTDSVIIAIIHSFSENGHECRLSYSQFADVMKTTRRGAMKHLKQLEADGYIIVTEVMTAENGHECNVYSVNYDAFEHEEESRGGEPEFTRGGEPEFTRGGEPEFTRVVNQSSPGTIKREKKERNERERRQKRKAFIPPTLEEVSSFVCENNLSVNPEKFFYWFEEKAWRGVKDWKKRIMQWNAEDKVKAGDQNSSFTEVEMNAAFEGDKWEDFN